MSSLLKVTTVAIACGAAAAITAISTPAFAQNTLAQRVARAPDGVVRVQFAGRAGTCGDGLSLIGFRNALFMGSFNSMGKWNAPNCRPGPVRVAISVANGRATGVKTSVGGGGPQSSDRVTDLGTVSPSEAATYFFGLIPQIERGAAGSRGRDKSRVLLPAVLADDPLAVPRLISLARDGARLEDTRRQAIQWIGLLGDARVVPVLVAFARDGGAGPTGGEIDEDDEAPGKKGLATTAMAALSTLDNGAGVPALIDLARSGSPATQVSAVFWLGQSRDPRAFATMRSIYPRLSNDKLKEAILQGMGEDESGGSAWLIERARDTGESLKMRKSALFWAGQKKSTPTRDLVGVYRAATESSMREHAIFVLSQRNDEAALNELMRIARDDSDKRMRSRALFWLGQKDDPRVVKMIGDRVLK